MPAQRNHSSASVSASASATAPVAQTVAQVVNGIFTKYDANANSTLTLAEMLAVLDASGTQTTLSARLATLLKAVDTNADSALSKAEVTAAVTRLDTNADGSLSRADRVPGSVDSDSKILVETLIRGRIDGGHSGSATPPTVAQAVSGLLTRFDTNASGTLTLSEIRAVLDPAGTRTTLATSLSALVTKIDTDANGILSTAEITAAVKALDTDADGLIERSDQVAGSHGVLDLMGLVQHSGDFGGSGC